MSVGAIIKLVLARRLQETVRTWVEERLRIFSIHVEEIFGVIEGSPQTWPSMKVVFRLPVLRRAGGDRGALDNYDAVSRMRGVQGTSGSCIRILTAPGVTVRGLLRGRLHHPSVKVRVGIPRVVAPVKVA